MARPESSAEAAAADASDAVDPLLPPVEELERLVLEAYNSLQSDGEFLFLPDDVAQQLHAVARMVRWEGEEAVIVRKNTGVTTVVMPSLQAQEAAGDDTEGETEQLGDQDVESGDEADEFADAIEGQQELDLQEPEEENDAMGQQQQQQQRALEATLKSPLLESKFMELPPVLEIDEEVRRPCERA